MTARKATLAAALLAAASAALAVRHHHASGQRGNSSAPISRAASPLRPERLSEAFVSALRSEHSQAGEWNRERAGPYRDLPKLTDAEKEMIAGLPMACVAGIEKLADPSQSQKHEPSPPDITNNCAESGRVAQADDSNDQKSGEHSATRASFQSTLAPDPGDSIPVHRLAPPSPAAESETIPPDPLATGTDFQPALLSTTPQAAPVPAQAPRDGQLHSTPVGDLSTPVSLASDPHAEVFARSHFPSAVECAQCHRQIYDEWSASSHAYAAISPMFHRFEEAITGLTSGTIGYFCMRCHAPVAAAMGMAREAPIYAGPRVFREGVTCVACHRVAEAYTKTNGERRIEEGDSLAPVFGTSDGAGVRQAAQNASFFKVKTDPQDTGPGQPMHRAAIQFEQLSQSDFCMSCHQVAVPPGIKLEVVWDQYRASPAYREGTTCQDCHMGRVPGVNAGFSCGPATVIDGKTVNPSRRHSNHIFFGPGYSIAHPGIFPDNPKADRWTVPAWLQFDWRGGWGEESFENAVADNRARVSFPTSWSDADDRRDAREIVQSNQRAIDYKRDLRRQVMENGCRLDGPQFTCTPQVGQDLGVTYGVTNLNAGHNLPTASLGAQPQFWLNAVLIGPDGRRLWETGYLDSHGDLADLHSLEVRAGRIPIDRQLFNLQTRFLTTNVKGTDREMYLPVNFDVDPLPFIRPAPQPVSVLNHPPFIRMEAHSLPPLGSRNASYVIPAACLQQPGTYRLSARLRSRVEPIYFMRSVGATPEMERRMIEGTLDVHPQTAVFEVR